MLNLRNTWSSMTGKCHRGQKFSILFSFGFYLTAHFLICPFSVCRLLVYSRQIKYEFTIPRLQNVFEDCEAMWVFSCLSLLVNLDPYLLKHGSFVCAKEEKRNGPRARSTNFPDSLQSGKHKFLHETVKLFSSILSHSFHFKKDYRRHANGSLKHLYSYFI